MSRSRRKTPCRGHCGDSDKEFKRQEHKRERLAVRRALHNGEDDMPHPKSFGNPWDAPKDGKWYFANSAWDNTHYQQLMRK